MIPEANTRAPNFTALTDADEKLARVLTCDPGMGVVRHADAGYPEALSTARQYGVRIPMQETSR